MKKLMLVLALTFTTSVMFTSCREEKSGIERAADDVGDEVEEVGDDLEDIGDDISN